jgi:hypothetical protein
MSIFLPFLGLVGLAFMFSPKKAPSSMKKREDFLNRVRAELGKKDPTPYEVDALGYKPTSKLSWCGIFALSMLRQVGLTNWKWEIGKGFLYRLPVTKNPLPGDLFYQHNQNHHGIVEEVRPDGMVVTLNGNSTGGAVARVVRQPSTIAAYYSIAPLLT